MYYKVKTTDNKQLGKSVSTQKHHTFAVGEPIALGLPTANFFWTFDGLVPLMLHLLTKALNAD